MKAIFHIPIKLDYNHASGSMFRPQMMMKAFRSLGYDLEVIEGSASERKKQIAILKSRIKGGEKFDFVYSESSTQPTLLTESHHFPTHPFLDFGFFKFCKQHQIPVGLFYRDVYWNFDYYKSTVSPLKGRIACQFYHYDLRQYNRWLDVLFLPSMRMRNFIPIELEMDVHDLPPAGGFEKELNQISSISDTEELKIFYVGGLNEMYRLHKLFKVVSEREGVKLVVSCRQEEWEKNQNEYQPYLNGKVEVVHKSKEELRAHFNEANLLSLFLEGNDYRTFAMPVKLFEYIGQQKPIIATKGTAAGDLVERFDIGWSVDYDESKLQALLDHLQAHPEKLVEKQKNLWEAARENTWEARATKVRDLLKASSAGNS